MVASNSDLDYAVALSLQEALNHCDDSSISSHKKAERKDKEALDFALALSLQEGEDMTDSGSQN